MRVERTRRPVVEDLRGLSVRLQQRWRRLRRQIQAAEVVRFIPRRIKANLKWLKLVRQLLCAGDKEFLFSFEFAEQGEVRIELRTPIPNAEFRNDAGEPFVRRTRWGKPQVKHAHERLVLPHLTSPYKGEEKNTVEANHSVNKSLNTYRNSLLHGDAFRQVAWTVHVDVAQDCDVVRQ